MKGSTLHPCPEPSAGLIPVAPGGSQGVVRAAARTQGYRALRTAPLCAGYRAAVRTASQVTEPGAPHRCVQVTQPCALLCAGSPGLLEFHHNGPTINRKYRTDCVALIPFLVMAASSVHLGAEHLHILAQLRCGSHEMRIVAN
ncbi:hypothetical protein U0070_012681, partial [Myodes glareolus]